MRAHWKASRAWLLVATSTISPNEPAATTDAISNQVATKRDMHCLEAWAKAAVAAPAHARAKTAATPNINTARSARLAAKHTCVWAAVVSINNQQRLTTATLRASVHLRTARCNFSTRKISTCIFSTKKHQHWNLSTKPKKRKALRLNISSYKSTKYFINSRKNLQYILSTVEKVYNYNWLVLSTFEFSSLLVCRVCVVYDY